MIQSIPSPCDPLPTLLNLLERKREGMLYCIRNERAVTRGLSILLRPKGREPNPLLTPQTDKRLLAIFLGCLGMIFLLTLTLLLTWIS